MRLLKNDYYLDDNYYKYNDNNKLPYISNKSTQMKKMKLLKKKNLY